MKLLDLIDRILHRIETTLLVLILLGMLFLSFLQVVLRNIPDVGGLIWIDPLIRHSLLWIAFLGAAVATRGNRHIAIDAFSRFLPVRWQSVTRSLTNAFAAVICYFLFEGSLGFMRQELDMPPRFIIEGLPLTTVQMIIPVGFILLIIHFSIRTFLSLEPLFASQERS